MKKHHLLLGALCLLISACAQPFEETIPEENQEQALQRYDLKTDTSKIAEDFEFSNIASGGPGKDGIPAINNPIFGTIENLPENNPNLEEEQLGIVVEHQGETRFYPYNILVWHEIVNDTIGDTALAVTFCPLCGSAIVYERAMGKNLLEFRVSGLLYESNLLMYDSETESLWSQIEGRAVVGTKVGTDLTLFPMQVMSFADAKGKYNSLQILSENTGYTRSYDIYPYGDYDENDELFFPVRYKGEDFSIRLKEILIAARYEDTPVAFVFKDLVETQTANLTLEDGIVITATYSDGEATITDDSGNTLPSYYAQWFSWANHNLEKGVRGDRNAQLWQKEQTNLE